ncbi:hypothetical protein [Sphingomicrobium arenosum]|uniref:hypothetical protein n=1 Tax=Sphingomicrobium arenosum TaxID=2233861 RepID=UPI00223ED52B|nr:hypothetical protein [Sphingomicrobium arenosum]
MDRDALEDYRPGLTLRFGITGHRPPRLANDQHDRIHAQCAEIFALARGAMDALAASETRLFAARDPAIKLVSSLAEGADVIAAEAALASGAQLVACLPLPRDTYARDFSAEAWARTEALIEQSGAVLTLDPNGHGAEASYEAAGRIVLAQCDILIAIWDGEAAAGRGGTTQIVAEAVAMHQPVIHIDARGERPAELLWSGLHEAIPDRPSLDGVRRTDMRRGIGPLVHALCAPPSAPEERAELDRFILGGDRRPRRATGWPLLMRLTGAKSWTGFAARAPSSAECAGAFAAHTRPFAEDGAFGVRLDGGIRTRFGRADSLASDYAQRFRSSFVTNFAMAGLAVFLALAGLLFPEGKKLLISIELLVILLIIANTRGANRQNLHKCWLDHRHLAERLRLLSMSAPLGRLALRDADDGTRHPDWVGWYVRASARELGLVRAEIDHAYLEKVRGVLLATIAEQRAYHHANAHAMQHSNHVLHRAGDALFAGTILACALYLILSFAIGKVPDAGAFSSTGLVTFVTALFPALAAALYGIRMQGDFAGNAERSAAIARQLEHLEHSLGADQPRFERLSERARRLGEIMLADVGQWRLHYESRPLTLPG